MTSFGFGDITVTRIEESLGPVFNPWHFLPDFDMEAVAPHMNWFSPDHFDTATEKLMVSMHSWLIRTPQHTILIDTCVGNHSHMPGMPAFHMQEFPWLDNLAAAGVQPEEVDYVLCTHLHFDHLGWHTRLEDGRFVPTFPNARYVISKTEYDNAAAGEAEMDENSAFNKRVMPASANWFQVIMVSATAWLSHRPPDIRRGMLPSPCQTAVTTACLSAT